MVISPVCIVFSQYNTFQSPAGEGEKKNGTAECPQAFHCPEIQNIFLIRQTPPRPPAWPRPQRHRGHAQASMVTEQYAHILDDDRRLNAQRFDDFFYQHHGAEPEALPRAEQSTPKASPVDTDAAAALAKLLADPSMATLIKNLAKNL